MISVHWTQLGAVIVAFGLGLLGGVFIHLPFDQASTLAGIFLGLLVGAIGVGATLWVAARDRELNLGEIRRDVADVKGDLTTLRAMAGELWTPVLSNMAVAQFGTSARPVPQQAIGHERSEPPPTTTAVPAKGETP